MRAFKKLVDEHRHRIFTFACYHLGDEEEAGDVTQEVLLRLWRHWERINPDRLPAWIGRVTRNACLDALRSRKSARRLVDVNSDSEGILQAVDDTPSPAMSAERADLRRQVAAALTRLSEPYRSLIIMREIQELKYEEISQVLEMPLNTTKVYLHRARRMLRESLRDVWQDEHT